MQLLWLICFPQMSQPQKYILPGSQSAILRRLIITPKYLRFHMLSFKMKCEVFPSLTIVTAFLGPFCKPYVLFKGDICRTFTRYKEGEINMNTRRQRLLNSSQHFLKFLFLARVQFFLTGIIPHLFIRLPLKTLLVFYFPLVEKIRIFSISEIQRLTENSKDVYAQHQV